MTNGSLSRTRSYSKSASKKDNIWLAVEVTCEQDSLASRVLFLSSRPFKLAPPAMTWMIPLGGILEYVLDYGIYVVLLCADPGSGEEISMPGSKGIGFGGDPASLGK